MSKSVSALTFLRFPVVFGSILILGCIAFRNRQHLLNLHNIEQEREALYQQNYEDVKLIEEYKREARRTK